MSTSGSVKIIIFTLIIVNLYLLKSLKNHFLDYKRTVRSHLLIQKNCIIGAMYRSPTSSYTDCCNKLDCALHVLASEDKFVVLLGDVNINILDNNSGVCSDHVNCFLSYGFLSLIHSSTTLGNECNGTLIDHVLTNVPFVSAARN